MRFRLAFVVAGALVVAMSPAFASGPQRSTLYVDRLDARCSDRGAGTAQRPFCTIGAAATTVTPGTTVLVSTGRYRERVAILRSGTRTAPIAFRAAPGANVTVYGRRNGFYLSKVRWVTVAGFAVDRTAGYGISAVDSSHITISTNRVSRAGKPTPAQSWSGIYVSNVRDSLVAGNVSFANSYAGIALSNGSTRNVVRGNLTYGNARGYQRAAPGIRLYAAPRNTVTRNISHSNEDSGIELYSDADDVLVSNNLTYANGDHGIDVYGARGARILANTVHGNVTSGINVENRSTGTQIRNNIAVDNGIASPRAAGNIRVDSTSTRGSAMNFDQVYLSRPGALIVWNSSTYASLAELAAATGQETGGIQADPAWVKPAAGDYHLTPLSPAIDSADSGMRGQPPRDKDGRCRVDDPGIPNTGIGPRSYDDRGALEFQPSRSSRSKSTTAPNGSQNGSPVGALDDDEDDDRRRDCR